MLEWQFGEDLLIFCVLVDKEILCSKMHLPNTLNYKFLRALKLSKKAIMRNKIFDIMELNEIVLRKF